MTTYVVVALLVVMAALIFWAGFLVGRNNPRRADKAQRLEESAVEKAREKAKEMNE